MAEIEKKRQELRKIGLYLLVILALLRFLVYPLRSAVADKEVALAEQVESYWLKSRLLLSPGEAKPGLKATEAVKTTLLAYVYGKERSGFDIQAEIIDTVRRFVEEKGMVITNLELPEPIRGKHVEEVPVILKLQGNMLSFLETLEKIQTNTPLLLVKSTEIRGMGKDFNYSLMITALRLLR